MNNLSNLVSNWLKYDTYIDQVNKKLKVIKDQKQVYEDKIKTEMHSKHLENSQFELNRNFIYMKKNESGIPLSMKFLRSCLMDLYRDPNKVDQIIEFINRKKNNEKKVSYVLKKRPIK